MIRITWPDGRTVAIDADSWTLNGPVLQVGPFNTIATTVVGWETLPDSDPEYAGGEDGV